jgi:hypothetical protein
VSTRTEPLRRLHAEALLRMGQTGRALAVLRTTLTNQVRLSTEGHNSVASTRVLLACALARQGDLAQARALWAQAHEVLLRDFGGANPFVLVAQSYLALADDARPFQGEQGQKLTQRLLQELGWQDGAQQLAQWLQEPMTAQRWAALPTVF